jgi:ATP-binding cassette subfamily C protein CydCD
MGAIDPRLLRRAGSSSRFLLLCIVIGLAIAACVLGQALTLATAISRVFLDGAGLRDISAPLIALAALTATRAALSYLQETAAARASATVKSQLRDGLMHRAIDGGPSWVSDHRTGEITQLATRGVEALDPYFARYLPQMVLTAIISPLFVMAIWATDWISGLVLVLTLPIVLLFMVIAGWSAQRRTNDQWRTLERLSNHFLDVVEGLTTLRVFGRARAQCQAVESVTQDYRRTTMGVLRLSFLSSFVLELFASLSVAIVAVQIGLRLIGGSIDLEVALIVLLLAPEAFQPLRTLGASYHAAAEGRSVTSKILDILDDPSLPPGTRTVHGALDVVAVQDVSVQRVDTTGCTSAVHTLAPISFPLYESGVVALVGPTGCGKSTLLSVMLGFLAPSAGTVRMNGVSVADADPQSWLGHIAWMPQRPTLVEGTVAGNVRLGAADATDHDVAAAMARAACHGIDPHRRIAQNGADLSAGERQRIALARCFLRAERGADLVLLDEPTAHLDAQTEQRVLAAIREVSVGRFVLMVAHRPSAIRFADRIIEVDTGVDTADADGHVPIGSVALS